jgi:uncharacterized protein
MDEILEKIQRRPAMDDKVESRAASPPSPEAATVQPILSPATASAAVAAFAQLASVRRQQRRMHEFPMGSEQRTIEDVVREVLQPLMRDWLEEKATPVIEQAVSAQLVRALRETDVG